MSEQTIQLIPLDRIIGREQVRKHFDEESLNGLTQSMRESGLHEPVHLLHLGDDKYSLLTGGRRMRAARKAGWTTIPAIIEDGELTNSEVLVRQIVENVQREDLTPLEKARAIDALIKETGGNATQVASKLGLGASTVSKLLSLLSLPEELQKRVDSGELPATTAYQLTKLDDPEAQKRLANQAVKGELTRDNVVTEVKQRNQKQRSRKARPVRVTARLEKRESVSVAADGLNLNSFVSILERLLSLAQKARSDGLTLQALLKRLSSAPKPPLAEPVAT